MKKTEIAVIRQFDDDVSKNGQYKYTGEKLSCKVANSRQTQAIISSYNLLGKSIIDAGCGDGTYTRELMAICNPSKIIGFDPSSRAIKSANTDPCGIEFRMSTIEDFTISKKFDVLIYRGVLHHTDNPKYAIQKALELAERVIILEPNGYNPILKIIEKVSQYHRDHGERSFGYRKLSTWIKNSGGRIIYHKRSGCVPFFCPDIAVRILKFVEPAVEKISLLTPLLCGVDVIVYKRR